MIHAERLLADLKRVLKRLQDDLRERARSVDTVRGHLEAEYRAARAAQRTGEAYESWREEAITQGAVAWILGCVFVRFMEDNGLVDPPLISGPDERRRLAMDRETLYFRDHPTDTWRDYLVDVFRSVAELPAAGELFDAAHNPVWSLPISGDAARELLGFFREVDPETGALARDFTDPEWDTRFLGDLYQDLSEAARKRYALLQTPEFVEEFILDRMLEPAIEEFGLAEVRMIDPACGSGHFLLGAFRRLLDRRFRAEPGTGERVLVQRALDAVNGVDINPFAAAIARFRLLVAALKASHVTRLDRAPAYHINVAAGDSLLHGRRFGELDLGNEAEQLRGVGAIGHAFHAEDLEALNRILGRQYHVVVGNPPYITVKDRALNQLYRTRYATCHMKYALAVPFTERFFDLAIYGDADRPAGYVGMITANSFMKREFGKKLVEQFLPAQDLTHIIDTSGAYIPGHGTPTVILFGRHRRPTTSTVRLVMGIRGEPATPANPADGHVWSAIVRQVDRSGSESAWASVIDAARNILNAHPWSVGGGGAAEVLQTLTTNSSGFIHEHVMSIGFASFTGTDDAFVADKRTFLRNRVSTEIIKPLVYGQIPRDWALHFDLFALVPYRYFSEPLDLSYDEGWARFLWPLRTTIGSVVSFAGKSRNQMGEPWWTWYRWITDKYRQRLSICYAEVATHNHFVMERGGNVFSQTAPVIKLPAGAGEAEHLGLVGLLNSSVACFWLKQVCHNKGSTVDARGARQTTDAFENFYQYNGTKVGKFPVTEERPLELATTLDALARERQAHLPAALAPQLPMTRAELDAHRAEAERLLRRMIALQEELDWKCYALYGVTNEALCHNAEVAGGSERFEHVPEVALGERAFEIVMARRMARGELDTTWFSRHRSTPVTEIPASWPEDYRKLVERRIALIASDRYVGLVERPEYKRRWNQEPWAEQEERALREWLLDRLETERYWPEPRLQSTRTLAAVAETDEDFRAVAALYRGHEGFDVHALVAELVEAEAVPFLPVLRYAPSGMRKRELWERTWELQRREDAIAAEVEAELPREAGEPEDRYRGRLEAEQRRRKAERIGDIPVPPKYRSGDFAHATFWRLRGALDVPKERFVSYPHCSREHDPALVLGWAGWDHLQQAIALSAWYTEVTEQEGWPVERLVPLLAGLLELLPWLRQWHNDVDATYHQRMGEFFASFLDAQLHRYGFTREDLRQWTPPATRRRRRRVAG